MSILINMKMPNNCEECPCYGGMYSKLCNASWEEGYGMGDYNGRPVHDNTVRQPWCPLIELPPHGRLIDADALPRFGGRKGLIHSADVDNAPTIIEAEPDCSTCKVKGKACKVFYRDKNDDSVCRKLRETIEAEKGEEDG